jgi:hypothetical protein
MASLLAVCLSGWLCGRMDFRVALWLAGCVVCTLRCGRVLARVASWPFGRIGGQVTVAVLLAVWLAEMYIIVQKCLQSLL